MNRPQDWLQHKYIDLFTLAFVLVFGVGMMFAAYIGHRSNTLNIGSFGDSPYLTNFYADEADVDYRYRWTKDTSEVSFVGAGNAAPAQVRIRVQGPPSSVYSGTITMTLSINGVVLQPASIRISDKLEEYNFDVPKAQPGGLPLHGPYTLAISSTTFRPAGDPRTLGVKLDSVSLIQSSDRPNTPPADLICWWALFLTAGTLILTPVRQWTRLALNIALPVFAAILFFNNVLFGGAYLPPVSAIATFVGVLVWQRGRLKVWPFAVEIAGSRARFAPLVMIAGLVAVAAVSLWAIPQVQWIGHADYAENANIARNFVQGRGLTVDYVAQFYKSYPGISHPAETWPLLQPVLIAPFFALFGPETWAAKLPNLLILLALAWGVFALGSRMWDGRAGLVAGLLTLFHPYFFNTVLYPINDLAFTAIFFFLAWLVWRALDAETPSTDQEVGKVGSPYGERNTRYALAIGAISGLLIWSKPSGAPLLVGLALWAVVVWWRYRQATEGAALPVRPLAAMAGAFLLVMLPLLVRNLLSLGTLYFSTESLDAWTLRYWPYIDWENIYRVYVGATDYPHPRWIVGGKFGYQNLVDAVSINFRWVWERGIMGGLKNSDFIIAPFPLVGALLGLVVMSRRAARLFVMVLISLGLYSLFVLLYWHFEGRYFQVFVPWLYLLLASGLIWVWDKLRSFINGQQKEWVAWIGPVLALAVLLWPYWGEMRDHLTNDTRATSFTVAMEWLSANSSASDVVMTRDPWELNWYTQRKAVMIPFEDLATIEQVAKEYGVTMLQIGGPADSADDFERCPVDGKAQGRYPTGSRPALGKLYCGYDIPGFTRVYQNNDLFIYRLTQTP